MMGQAIRGGTAFSQILLDDQALPELLKAVEIDKHVLEEEEAGDLSEWNKTYVTAADPCSMSQLQMTMIMPEAKAPIDEDDIGIIEV